MTKEEALELLCSRRTVRHFDGRPVGPERLDNLMEAARWAPSGMNNQPWRFIPIEGRDTLEKLSVCTKYGKLVRSSPAAIAVFLDNEAVYNRTKDVQSVGAALENLLLCAHLQGLGACWLGEILNKREEAEKVLGVDKSMELMALVLVGWPKPGAHEGDRDRADLASLVIGKF